MNQLLSQEMKIKDLVKQLKQSQTTTATLFKNISKLESLFDGKMSKMEQLLISPSRVSKESVATLNRRYLEVRVL